MSEVLSDREAVIFYAEQRGYASAMEAERKLHEARIEAQAAEIERLRGDLKRAVEAGVDVAASLSAAISLLQRGGKKAAPSDKMFNQMLADYNASLDRLRTIFAEPTGEQP